MNTPAATPSWRSASKVKVNKSLHKALRLLTCFSEAKPEWSVSELSRTTRFAKSSVSTMLATLAEMDIVRQSPTTRRYQLGLRCLELGYLASSRLILRDYALPHLEVLLGDNSCIVYLAIPYQREILYLDALYPPHRKINYSSQGRRAPMYCTGIGKAALAFMSESYLTEFLQSVPLHKNTPNTITDPAVLREELARISERGYATDLQEREPGIQCVAAPVRLRDGTVAASISLSGSADEVSSDRFPELGRAVMETARDVSSKLVTAGFTSS